MTTLLDARDGVNIGISVEWGSCDKQSDGGHRESLGSHLTRLSTNMLHYLQHLLAVHLFSLPVVG